MLAKPVHQTPAVTRNKKTSKYFIFIKKNVIDSNNSIVEVIREPGETVPRLRSGFIPQAEKLGIKVKTIGGELFLIDPKASELRGSVYVETR